MREISIIGQGYVGLPLARTFVAAGFKVVGVDNSEENVRGLRNSISRVQDVSNDDVKEMLKLGYRPTTDFSEIKHSEAVIICVPTPLQVNGEPDLSYVVGAAKSVIAHLRQNALIILESTTYPGTTEEILLPLFEASGLKHGEDFHLAFSPERIDPGNTTFGIQNTPKVVGGVSQAAGSRATELYGKVCDVVIQVSGTREAEMSKLLENTYRHVNIALVNELAIVCNELGIDIREVIRAAETKPFGFAAFQPGPGVGGHCIPIDPNYLDYKVRESLGRKFEFISLATRINAEMPNYVANRIANLLQAEDSERQDNTILLVGVSYKRNISDVRESPAEALAKSLMDRGFRVDYHDPLVRTWAVGQVQLTNISQLGTNLRSYACTVLLQNHDVIDLDSLVRYSKLIFDTRGVLAKDNPNIHHL